MQKFAHIMQPNLDSNVIYPQSSGLSLGLKIVLDTSHYVIERNNEMYKPVPPFKLALHDPKMPADLRRAGVEVEPGYKSTFLITPSIVESSSEIRSMDQASRGCKFEEENENRHQSCKSEKSP